MRVDAYIAQATTGALLLAVNETSARHITRQIQSGLLSKTYLALVRGKTGANGEITAPLLGRGKQMVVSKDGKEALTVCPSTFIQFRLSLCWVIIEMETDILIRTSRLSSLHPIN